MTEQIETGDVVQVVMLKGLLDQINMQLESFGWRLLRAPWLDEEEPDAIPTFLATIASGGPAEARLRSQS